MASESKEGSELDTNNTTYYAMINGTPHAINRREIPYLNADEKRDLQKGLHEYYSSHMSEEATRALIHDILSTPKQVNRGSGSYGMVISPALPNTIHGKQYRFPNQVTKLIYLKKTRKNTLNTANTIRREVPELYYNILPYERPVTLSNISNPEIKTKLKERISKKAHVSVNTLTNNTELYPVRMKDMGYSIGSYYDSVYRLPGGDLYKSILRIPFRTILQNMSNLAGIVNTMYERGYAHLDIRETNVLVNPNSGELHIIDFDFFMKLSNYYTKYTNIFYAHPVEEAILKIQDNRDVLETIMMNPIDFTHIPKVLYKKLYKIIEPQCTVLYHGFQPFSGPSVNEFIDLILREEFIPGLEQFKIFIYTTYGPPTEDNREVYIENYISVMYNNLLRTIDSYGLGIALQYLIKIYDYYGKLPNTKAITAYYPWLNNNSKHINKFKEVMEIVIDYIERLTTFNITERFVASDFKSAIDSVLDDYNTFYRTEGLPIVSKRPLTYRFTRSKNMRRQMTPIEEVNETDSSRRSRSK